MANSATATPVVAPVESAPVTQIPNAQNPRASVTDADKTKDKNLTVTFRFSSKDNDKVLRAYLKSNGVVLDGIESAPQNAYFKQVIAEMIGADLAKEETRKKVARTALPAPLANLSAKDRQTKVNLLLEEMAKNPEKYANVLAVLASGGTAQQAEQAADAAKLEASLTPTPDAS